MAFDGFGWGGRGPAGEAGAGEARARLAGAAAAAERAWVATFLPTEDPWGPAPPASSHPDRAPARERFRAAHAALAARLDADGADDAAEAEDDGAPLEDPFGD